MSRVRTLIVDDEPLARDRIRVFLRDEPVVDIVGESSNGPDAIVAIRQHRPDLVFLDVDMPGCDGFAVVAALLPEERPAVVFVTAHDRFAVDAFRIEAVDYLLKPFDRERIRAALQLVIERRRVLRADDLHARVEKLLEDSTAVPRKPERFAVRSKGRIVFVAPGDIVRVESADNCVFLHLRNHERVMLRESLSAIEKRLGTDEFARVNRSTLVPLAQIKELRGTIYGDYTVILRDGTRVPLSRSLRGRFEKFTTGGA